MQEIKIKHGFRFIHKLFFYPFFYPFSIQDIRTLLFCCCLFISLIITTVLLLVYLRIILDQNGTIDPIKSLINHSNSWCFQKYGSNSLCLYVQNLTCALRRLPALPKTGHSRKTGAQNPILPPLYNHWSPRYLVPITPTLCAPSISGFKPQVSVILCYSTLRGKDKTLVSYQHIAFLPESPLPSWKQQKEFVPAFTKKCRGVTQTCTAPSSRSPCLPPSNNFHRWNFCLPWRKLSSVLGSLSLTLNGAGAQLQVLLSPRSLQPAAALLCRTSQTIVK